MALGTRITARRSAALLAALLLLAAPPAAAQVTTADELVAAVTGGAAGDRVVVAPGVFELSEPLRPKAGMTIEGAGPDQTVLVGAASWVPGTGGLPDNAVDHRTVNRGAYLVDLGDRVRDVTITNLTLRGPALHGAITGNDCDGLEVRGVLVDDFLWSGIRTFRMGGATFVGNEFVNAGGQFRDTGGAIYATWFSDTEIAHNVMRRTDGRNFYGVKGRQARRVRIHHNTIMAYFTIELPFESDEYVEIDHNYLLAPVSIPKYAGGVVPEGGYTFHIHHNYFRSSYALEWTRNGAEVDHNLFDSKLEDDKGNIMASFGKTPAEGPTRFHNNLVKNPGRGVFWAEGVFNNIEFSNNHVIANKTPTPRTDGLFGFNGNSDFSTVSVTDNVIEVIGLDRPLMRNDQSYSATIQNNRLIGVSDTDRYENPQTGAPQGLLEPLAFRLGANEAYEVDGWELREVADGPAPPTGQTVWLQAEINGRYVAADLNREGRLIADRTRARGWERFAVTDGGDADPATVAFRANANGRYVTAAPGAALASRAEAVGDAERFVWEPNDDGTVCLRSVGTGAYVVAESAGREPLRADRPACREWERFAWADVDAPSLAVAPASVAAADAAFGLAVYPNPARGPAAVVRFGLPAEGDVRVEAFDVLGRRVAVLAEGSFGAGWHEASLAAGSLPSGVYVVRFATGGEVAVRQVTVAR